jgi:hypothetical protein
VIDFEQIAEEYGRDLPPVHIDIERMKRALAGPRWTLPNGLTHEQICQYMTDCAEGRIAPDPDHTGPEITGSTTP